MTTQAYPELSDSIDMELYNFIPVHADGPKEPTFLYPLEPIGVGTPFVESLASYLTRLSAAHMLPPSAMLREVIVPYLPAKLSRNFDNTIGHQGVITNMNGIREEAETMVGILEQLTGRTNLARLTMLPFSNLLARYELQDMDNSWCPYCLEQQRAFGQPVHYHLLWSLRVAKFCPLHRSGLWQSCPHCKSVQPIIGSRSVNGYCYKCQTWLGIGSNGITKSVGAGEGNFFVRLFTWQYTVGQKRKQQSFPSMLEYLIGHHMKWKNAASIARLLHLPTSIIEELLANKMLPALGVIFWIGRVFKIDPFDILTKTGEEMAAKDQEEAAKVNHITFDLNRINWKQLEGLLRDVANGRASLMRVEDIARVYKCSTEEIISRYPVVCGDIIRKTSN